ncbi:hypothetical protein OQA88_2357 [Cercophora sp. LCS_1]
MRLLNAHTLEFEEFDNDDTIPRYAILSHTWGADEVTYKDMHKYRELAEEKEGFTKIQFCAWQAIQDDLAYIWVDTCCINKSSSSELSEAINSMFRYYRDSHACYVHLADVPQRPGDGDFDDSIILVDFVQASVQLDPKEIEHQIWQRQFLESRWFTRGWTLQELTAPFQVEFYSSDCQRLGSKSSLQDLISRATRIPLAVLRDPLTVTSTSIAQRMSWAANRQTSRKEDLAYCLMGLFDINMPMIYGEGDRAFIRLQEEIIKASDDTSIFAWVDEDKLFSAYNGLLATSPSHFKKCTNTTWSGGHLNAPHDITNKGIRIPLRLTERRTGEPQLLNEYIAVLEGVTNLLPAGALGIFLRKIGPNQYARVDANRPLPTLFGPQLAAMSVNEFPVTPVFIRQKITVLDPTPEYSYQRVSRILLRSRPSLSLRTSYDRDDSVTLTTQLQPISWWNDEEHAFYNQGAEGKGPLIPATFNFEVQRFHHTDDFAITVDVQGPLSDILRITTGDQIPSVTRSHYSYLGGRQESFRFKTQKGVEIGVFLSCRISNRSPVLDMYISVDDATKLTAEEGLTAKTSTTQWVPS